MVCANHRLHLVSAIAETLCAEVLPRLLGGRLQVIEGAVSPYPDVVETCDYHQRFRHIPLGPGECATEVQDTVRVVAIAYEILADSRPERPQYLIE